MTKVILCLAIMILLTGCVSTSSTFVSPSATISPTLTFVPEPTATPEPELVGISDILTNCDQLGESENPVEVEGKIFLPDYRILGYEGWKGMNLAQYLSTDKNILTVLMKVGEGPNTMDPLPEFFANRDLIIRAEDGQLIYHGFSVSIIGHVEYQPENENLQCALRVEKITSMMAPEVLIPQTVEIGYLLEEINLGSPSKPDLSTNCAQLANEKQFVSIKAMIQDITQEPQCAMGNCELLINDNTGEIAILLHEGDLVNSILTSTEGWKIIDQEGNEIGEETIIFTGLLYTPPQGCLLTVYTIAKSEIVQK